MEQRLIPEYQIDRFIGVVLRLKKHDNLLVLISGHGTPSYEAYLDKLTNQMYLSDSIRLCGYMRDEDLRLQYIATDLFVTVPCISAGSGSAIKAMAIGSPVFHTKTGMISHFLASQNAGVLVDPYDYYTWVTALQSVIDKIGDVKKVSRSKIIDHFSWKRTADQTYSSIKLLLGEKQ